MNLLKTKSPVYELFQRVDLFLDNLIFNSYDSSFNFIHRAFYFVLLTVLRILFYSLSFTIVPQVIYHCLIRIFSFVILIVYYLYLCLFGSTTSFLDKSLASCSFFLKNSYKSRKFHVWSYLHYLSLIFNFLFGVLFPLIPDYLFSISYKPVKNNNFKIVNHSKVSILIFVGISLLNNLICIDIVQFFVGPISIYFQFLLFVVLSLAMYLMYRDLIQEERDDYFNPTNDYLGIKGFLFGYFDLNLIQWE